MYLVDTNVVSELRKGPAANTHVVSWFQDQAPESLYLSVLTVGELRRGVERLRRRDPASASALDGWLQKLIERHSRQLVGIDQATAEEWGRLNVPDPVPVVDGLLAATAKVRGMTLVTRNVKDIRATRVDYLNPFEPPS